MGKQSAKSASVFHGDMKRYSGLHPAWLPGEPANSPTCPKKELLCLPSRGLLPPWASFPRTHESSEVGVKRTFWRFGLNFQVWVKENNINYCAWVHVPAHTSTHIRDEADGSGSGEGMCCRAEWTELPSPQGAPESDTADSARVSSIQLPRQI